MAAVAGVDKPRYSMHKNRIDALDVYTRAYFRNKVHAYPLPGSKFWTPPLGLDRMRSISQVSASDASSSSSSAFWGHYVGAEHLDPHREGNTGARSTALEMQLALMGFDV